jgi:hypothetical protein
MTDETPSPAKRSRRQAPEGEVASPPVELLPIAQEPVSEPIAEPVAPTVNIASLSLERGGISEVTADTVDVRFGGIGSLDADEVFVQWGGVGAAKAERVSVEFGSVAAAMTGELRVTQGFANSVLAREATIEQGFVRTLIAQHVTIARPSAVLVMIAQRVTGDVRPVLDWRGALAFGAAFGLVSGILTLRRRR